MPTEVGAHSGDGRPEQRLPRLVVWLNGAVCELSAIAIESIEPHSTISDVPGSTLGMALIRGQVVPVLRLGPEPGPLVVGCVRGEVIALSGVQVLGWIPEELPAGAVLQASALAEAQTPERLLDVEALLGDRVD